MREPMIELISDISTCAQKYAWAAQFLKEAPRIVVLFQERNGVERAVATQREPPIIGRPRVSRPPQAMDHFHASTARRLHGAAA